MKLGIPHTTARTFYARVLKQSGGVEDLNEMLEHLESKPRPGAPPIIEPGEQSTQVRELVRKRPTFQRTEAANFEGPISSAPLKESTVRRVLYEPKYCLADPIDQRPIKARKRVRKTALDSPHKRQRLSYVDELEEIDGHTCEEVVEKEVDGDQELDHNVILIGVDEYSVTFGGAPSGFINLPEGTDAYEYAQGVPQERFSLMQWGAACAHPSALNLTRPQRIWEPETQELTQELANKLKAKIELLETTVKKQRENARIEGTPEWRHMERVNRAIEEHNRTIPKGVRKGRKYKRRIEAEFPFQDFKIDTRKGGLDYCWYAFEIYEKELIPYYKKIAALNPTKRVLITEDSAPPHIRARKLLQAEIEEVGMEFVQWPSISPDLHPIEDIQKHHKNLLDELRFEISSASRATKQTAKDEMKRIWQRDPGFTKIVEEVGSIQNYMRLGALCKAHEGGNNFNA